MMRRKRSTIYDANAAHRESSCPISTLSVAVGDYDRNRPLIDGAVHIDGVDPVFMMLSPEEIFFRAFRSADFDICELSLSSFTVKTALGDCPYVGVPAFVSRAFRHTSIYVRTDRIKEPKDLKGTQGRRAGISAHRQRLGARHPGGRLRRQARRHQLGARRHRGAGPAGEDHDQAAAGVRLDNAPEGATISALLDDGEIDGFIAPRPPSFIERGHPQCRLAVPRSDRGREGLFQAHRHLSDHASDRRPPHAGREASVAAGRGVQGVRAVEDGGARSAQRHLGDQGDAALRRGDGSKRRAN